MGRVSRTLENVAHFAAGLAAGAAGVVLIESLTSRRGLDPSLIRVPADRDDIPTTVIIPGILGSELLRPDGTPVWLNARNAIGSYDLSLPLTLPLHASRDDLVPGTLLGTEALFPRLFGFSEYADLLELLRGAGFQPLRDTPPAGASFHVFGYDWRRDLVESARDLHETLEALAHRRRNPQARFNIVGHSMGGLVARYYLRYGTAEPEDDAPVTWAGARRIQNLVVVAAPNGGSIAALDTILNGSKVGFSSTTLSPAVVAGMPAIYQLLPPEGTRVLLGEHCQPLEADLHDPASWERFGWAPFGDRPAGPAGDAVEPVLDRDAHRTFVRAALARARVFYRALNRRPTTTCPVRVQALGGDCLPTLARAMVLENEGLRPRFESSNRDEARGLFEAGDGRVPRASVLATHLPGAEDSDTGSGLPELAQALFGSADHHGIYDEPTFQSALLRILLRPPRGRSQPRTAVTRA